MNSQMLTRLCTPFRSGARLTFVSGDGTAAAAEFQKILDHRGLIGDDVTGALAHLYLGRAHALEARSLEGAAAENAKAKARAAYQDFLNLWKDADPDIPSFVRPKLSTRSYNSDSGIQPWR